MWGFAPDELDTVGCVPGADAAIDARERDPFWRRILRTAALHSHTDGIHVHSRIETAAVAMVMSDG